MHYSAPNHSDKRRIGLAVRVIVRIVEVLRYDARNHRTLVISGEDRIGLNKAGRSPD